MIQHSVQRLELRRSPAAFRLEHDLSFDPLLWRHYGAVTRVLHEFRPDVIHVTGPSDVGQLGALLGHRMHVPMVFSWHTNLHQYAALRSSKWCRWLPPTVRGRLLAAVERRALDAALLFYRIPRVVLAPNDDLVTLLAHRTGKPAHLMAHGVDADLFAPRPRDDDRSCVRIGFVGRLSAEKQVRLLAAIDRALRARGDTRFQFVVIGDGSERAWLQQAMPAAEFPACSRASGSLARMRASICSRSPRGPRPSGSLCSKRWRRVCRSSRWRTAARGSSSSTASRAGWLETRRSSSTRPRC